jgi:hypothetical protein
MSYELLVLLSIAILAAPSMPLFSPKKEIRMETSSDSAIVNRFLNSFSKYGKKIVDALLRPPPRITPS